MASVGRRGLVLFIYIYKLVLLAWQFLRMVLSSDKISHVALSLYKIARAFGFFACLAVFLINELRRPMKTWTKTHIIDITLHILLTYVFKYYSMSLKTSCKIC